MIQTKSIRKRLDNVVKALNVDKDMFYWAFCSVFTRSFAGDQKADCTIPEWFKQPEGSTDFPLNAPLVDLANHGTNMKLLCWSGLNKKNGSMYLRTHKPIKKGTELCISYGLGEFRIKGIPNPIYFIFETNVGTSRIRQRKTLNYNEIIINRF